MDRGEKLTAGKPTATGGFCYDNLGNDNGNSNSNCNGTVPRHGRINNTQRNRKIHKRRLAFTRRLCVYMSISTWPETTAD